LLRLGTFEKDLLVTVCYWNGSGLLSSTSVLGEWAVCNINVTNQ